MLCSEMFIVDLCRLWWVELAANKKKKKKKKDNAPGPNPHPTAPEADARNTATSTLLYMPNCTSGPETPGLDQGSDL